MYGEETDNGFLNDQQFFVIIWVHMHDSHSTSSVAHKDETENTGTQKQFRTSLRNADTLMCCIRMDYFGFRDIFSFTNTEMPTAPI